jgi:hypothetical protein
MTIEYTYEDEDDVVSRWFYSICWRQLCLDISRGAI